MSFTLILGVHLPIRGCAVASFCLAFQHAFSRSTGCPAGNRCFLSQRSLCNRHNRIKFLGVLAGTLGLICRATFFCLPVHGYAVNIWVRFAIGER